MEEIIVSIGLSSPIANKWRQQFRKLGLDGLNCPYYLTPKEMTTQVLPVNVPLFRGGKNNEYDADRYAGVLELVRDKSSWNKPGNEKYNRGVAAYFCHNSYAAHVVDMVTRYGQPYVERVFSAMDCGIVINPDAATNMVQGAVVDGIGNSFYGELTFKDGAPQKNNFSNYRMIRINEVPKSIQVHFVQNELDPTGLGEPPFPPVFGAVANALYKLKGKRYHNQPFRDETEKVM